MIVRYSVPDGYAPDFWVGQICSGETQYLVKVVSDVMKEVMDAEI